MLDEMLKYYPLITGTIGMVTGVTGMFISIFTRRDASRDARAKLQANQLSIDAQLLEGSDDELLIRIFNPARRIYRIRSIENFGSFDWSIGPVQSKIRKSTDTEKIYTINSWNHRHIVNWEILPSENLQINRVIAIIVRIRFQSQFYMAKLSPWSGRKECQMTVGLSIEGVGQNATTSTLTVRANVPVPPNGFDHAYDMGSPIEFRVR